MTNKKSIQYGEVRIIGGKWRSRKLKFPAIEGLRPTPDRVRETVFNWLSPHIAEANCLDLFAGSGALGVEALSRGAAHVTFVDQSREITKYLNEQLKLFGAENTEVHCSTFNPALTLPHKAAFDIVFLDPPFHKDFIQQSCAWLEQNKLLADDALIYIEAEAELNPLPIPENWEILRSKIAGQVGYHLCKKILIK